LCRTRLDGCPRAPSVNFNYDCAGVGAFTVALRRDGEKISVSIDPDDAAPPADLPRSAPHGEARSAPQATKSQPELVIETTSVGAVIAANGPAAAGFVESVSAPNNPVVQVPVTSQQSSAAVAPVAPVAPLAPTSSPPIDRLFKLMCDAKASDLHLSVGMKPLVRKDGEIKVLDESAPAFDVESMWAMLEPIIPARNREEFDRRHDTDFAYEITGLGRFRSNIFMDRKGPGAVFRVIPSKILTAEDLGLSPHILKLCQLNKGLVLVTGPTGSGKSTTLCAMVDYINRTRRDHIITIEDPIEFVTKTSSVLMNQREVHVHTDGFKDALRAALREDPDIVLGRRDARSRDGRNRHRDR
jgi:twitching motility protein PilT